MTLRERRSPAHFTADVRMLKLSPTEYRELKAFLAFFSQRFFNLDRLAPENRPIAALEAMEAKAPRKAAEGLRMAINDCLEMTSSWPFDRVKALDAELQGSGVMTLSALRQGYSREFMRLLKRGRIKTEVEYYLVKGILDGDAFNSAPEQRVLLDQMLNEYEKRAS